MIKIREAFQQNILIWLFIAGALYWLCSSLFYVGYFTDDGLFITLAESLVSGKYQSIYAPHPLPLTDPLPGFPLLLTPGAALFGHNLPLYRFFPLVLTLISGIVLFRVQKTLSNPAWAALSSAFFLLNATTVRYAGAVMAESAYLALTLLAVWVLTQEKTWAPYAAGVTLGWASLTRPQGVIFFLAVLLALLLSRKWKTLFIVTTVAIIPIAAFLLRNFSLSGEISGYMTNLERHASLTFHVAHYFSQLKAILGMIFPLMIFEIPFVPSVVLRRWVAWTCIGIGLACVLFGLIRHKKNTAVQVGFFTVLLSLVSLPFWFALELRYVWILLPWIVLVGSLGAIELVRRYRWFGFLLLSLILTHARANFLNIQEAKRAERLGQKPSRTFQWIVENSPPTARFLSDMAPVVYLYTNRKCEAFFLSQSKEDFLRTLREEHISYVVLTDRSLAGEAGLPGILRRQIGDWILRNGDFEPVFEDPQEGTKIYFSRL